MNTEEARVKISGRQGWGPGGDKRGVEAAPDRDLPRRSVEILRDLGQIAAALNGRGIATARGGKWEAATMRNILKRVA